MYAGQKWFDLKAAQGVAGRRRNPKRKNRLPYHAKKHAGVLSVMGENRICFHALAKHEELNVPHRYIDGEKQRVTVSYALACVSKHSSKAVQHRDTLGRKW
jgi:hypothetical protein